MFAKRKHTFFQSNLTATVLTSRSQQIQELNYRITVTLNSDSRSDVEGVRWIITKRAIGALAACVIMVIGSLKYASSAMQWQEEERKRFAAMGPVAGNGNGNGGSGGGGGDSAPRRDDGLGAGEMLVQQGDNPAFVSLG